ncbi:sulfatase-like hydrolase/transferase [Gallaecimonas kandeliae]|uniref:sulfatase-like hydrolase/transferase n=1 Tax=Gallaecimonas kandeliae TaxID=3029055 RepID=UPI002648E5D2|nr:sulfatase-like hydrolase/transferase [Gallaecimonas kandeliae]WKE67363.1 sulfatase-like hydrolase/transferase [Gallaecimonas kandeliae]
MNPSKRPNILVIMTDEERFPPPYENAEAKAWRLQHCPGREAIARNSIRCQNHYTGATACSPARATLFTGQYPSLHGVSQTPGMGKSSFDPAMFWLDAASLPTMGHWFQALGYQTYYRGKWHLSDEDLLVPGTRTALLTTDTEGNPIPSKMRNYQAANRLKPYGWDGWIGPEPHGALEANDGTNRDPGFADQVCRTLDELEAKARAGDERPFVLVSSFVNPHDIVFFDVDWFDEFREQLREGDLPQVDPAPTAGEDLSSKPSCQADYASQYPLFYLPQPDIARYRQFYYWLMAEVDSHIDRVYQKLQQCSFFEDTIVVFTSDHGEMLGAHGGLHQKWYNAYEETLHVPFYLSYPAGLKPGEHQGLTSHLDLLPTLLGLAGAGTREQQALAETFKARYTEAAPLVGQDLSPWLRDADDGQPRTLYFMSDDTVETGADMRGAHSGKPYRPVTEPKHLETIITTEIPGGRWKFSRYFDNPRFSEGPGNADGLPVPTGVPEQFECYNLDSDPLELINLMAEENRSQLPDQVLGQLRLLLAEQRVSKRRLPQNLNQEPAQDLG